MKLDCEVIQDLLPLYIDNICSPKSREIVDTHVRECPDCMAQLKALDDHTVTKELLQERDRVLETHKKKEKKRSAMIGMITAACLTVPVIVCLICNIAIGHALDWFFIVLTSLCVFASVTVVPLLVSENRFLWSMVSFILSLTALLGTVCLYTGGDWFIIAIVPAVAGLLICFTPFIIRLIKLPEVLKHHKAFLTVLIDTVAVYSIVVAAGFYTKASGYWYPALLITSFCMILPWAILGVARYLRIRKMFKASLISLICGAFGGFINDVVGIAIGEFDRLNLAKADFTNWNFYSNNGNVAWIFIITGIALSVIFAVLGIVKRVSEDKR